MRKRQSLAIFKSGDMPAACILFCDPIMREDRAQCEASGKVHGTIRAPLGRLGIYPIAAHDKAIHPQALRSRVLLMEVLAAFCPQMAAHGSRATEKQK